MKRVLTRSTTLLVVAAVGVLVALAIGDAFRSGRSSSAANTAPTTTPAPTTDTAPPPQLHPRARGGADAEYLRGLPDRTVRRLSASRRRGRRRERHLSRREESDEVALRRPSERFLGLPRPCEGRSGCEKPSGEAVSAHFADALDDPEWEMERIANRWARVFASTNGGCSGHMTQPLCERIGCERAGEVKIPNCTPPTTAYRRSFGKARLEEIAIKGERVAARFSNGELISSSGSSEATGWFTSSADKRAARSSSSRERNGQDENRLPRCRLRSRHWDACRLRGEGGSGRAIVYVRQEQSGPGFIEGSFSYVSVVGSDGKTVPTKRLQGSTQNDPVLSRGSSTRCRRVPSRQLPARLLGQLRGT